MAASSAQTRPAPTALPGRTEAAHRYGDRGVAWFDAMWRGDPLADAVVGDGALLVRRAIAQSIKSIENPPPALVALFAELDDPPAWVRPERCDRAAEHLARQPREYGFVLGAASLLAGAQNSVAGQPLRFTGRYASDAAMRSIEVGAWLNSVTTPGGLERDGQGFEHTVRVRMIHAHVRAHLSGHRDWRSEEWGVPIPQPYMAFTLAEFCSIALRAMAKLGVAYSHAEVEDILHLWRVVGWMIGVEEELLPVSLADYERIEDLYALASPGVDAGDREFVQALSGFQAAELARDVPARISRPLVHGMQRAFVGDRLADSLAIPDTMWKHLPRVLAPLNAAAYRCHDSLIPEGRARRTRRAYDFREREMQRLRREYGVDHDLVDETA